MVEKDFLDHLLELAGYDEVGMVGLKIYYYPEKEYINSAGGKMIWPWVMAQNRGIGELDQGQYDEIE